MAKSQRDLGREVLEGIRELKRGKRGRVAVVPRRLFTVRGQRVILDSDLAKLYGVPTKRLNELVRRYPQRFPPDFMFLLSNEEWDTIRSELAPSKGRRMHRRFLPYVFTELGALMASGLVNSARAVQVSLFIVRALINPPADGLADPLDRFSHPLD